MSYGNGIKLTTGFDVGAKTPLDNKSVVETIAERDSFVTNNLAYEGLEVYVKETKTKYRYNGTEWEVANGGAGLSSEQAQKLETAYEHSQSTHVSVSDIPTKVSDLENDSSFVTQTEMTNAINNAQLGGGSAEVDLSIYKKIKEDTLTTTATTIP